MKFKLGDKVKVKSLEWYDTMIKDDSGGIRYNNESFVENMKTHCGKEAVVVKLGEDYYSLDIDRGFWSWYDWMLEDDPIQEEECNPQFADDEDINESTNFGKILLKMMATYKAKNADYGNSFDKTLNEFGLVAATVRLSDKMDRIKMLTKKEAKVLDESIEDTLLDLANYSAMALVWLKNKEK